MIKVLQVVGNLRIGGAETVAMNIFRYIDKNVYELHYLVYGEKEGDYEDEVTKLGGKVIHTQYPKNLFQYKKLLYKLNNEYGPYSIIHSHMMFHNGIVLSAAKKIGIYGRVSHAHSTNDGSNANNFVYDMIRKFYVRYSRKLIVRNATAYIGCGQAAGEFLYGKDFFALKGKLIKNGIDTKKYSFNPIVRAQIRKSYNLSDKLVFACVGHFDVVKNHQFVIALFAEVCKKNQNCRLILLGDGCLKHDIELMVQREQLSDRVLFTGNVPNIHEWLQAVDCLLMPSLYEGVPLTLIEAQTSGLKCLVSLNVSQESSITDCVEFIPLENPQMWIKSMCDINYERRDRLIDIVKKGYDVADRMNEIYGIYKEQKLV